MKDEAMQIIKHRRALKEKTEHNFLDVMLDEKDLYNDDEQVL